MGYLEELTIGSFRKDADGRNVFYPYGILGKGHILPGAEAVARMRTSMEGLYLMILACVIPLLILYGTFELSHAYLIGLAAIAVIGVPLYIRNLVRGLPYSTERLTLREVGREVVRGDSAALLVLIAIASCICVLISIMMVLPSDSSTDFVCTLFFTACLSTFMRKIRLKRQG